MAGKKKTAKRNTSAKVREIAGGWTEVPSTANIRWYIPGEDADTAITVSVTERQDKNTRFGERAFYLCTVLTDSQDEKGDLLRGTPVMIWESAGLSDLNRFIGQEVKIVPDGRVKRTKVYRFFTRGGQPNARKRQIDRDRDDREDDEGEAA